MAAIWYSWLIRQIFILNMRFKKNEMLIFTFISLKLGEIFVLAKKVPILHEPAVRWPSV